MSGIVELGSLSEMRNGSDPIEMPLIGDLLPHAANEDPTDEPCWVLFEEQWRNRDTGEVSRISHLYPDQDGFGHLRTLNLADTASAAAERGPFSACPCAPAYDWMEMDDGTSTLVVLHNAQ